MYKGTPEEDIPTCYKQQQQQRQSAADPVGETVHNSVCGDLAPCGEVHAGPLASRSGLSQPVPLQPPVQHLKTDCLHQGEQHIPLPWYTPTMCVLIVHKLGAEPLHLVA